MEPLYPQNILERHYPILREKREKEEREAREEDLREPIGMFALVDEPEPKLYENEPISEGFVGSRLNTLA